MIKHFFYSGSGQTIKMQTENLGVVYYVNKDFKNEYKGMLLQKVEKSVEEDYVTNIRNNCWKERQQSKFMKCLTFKNLESLELIIIDFPTQEMFRIAWHIIGAQYLRQCVLCGLITVFGT